MASWWGAGEGGEHQLSGVGMALVDLHAGALLVHLLYVVHVGEVQVRVHPLGVEVQRQVHNIRVAGALPVAEEGALHPLGPGHQAQLGGGGGGAPVVVGVQAYDGAVPVL